MVSFIHKLRQLKKWQLLLLSSELHWTPLNTVAPVLAANGFLTAPNVKVKEYKGPKYDDSKAPVADLTFDFKLSVIGVSDNACDFNNFTDPEIAAYRSLTDADIDGLQPGKQLAGATTVGNFALGCCIYQNDKMEYRVKVTKADAFQRSQYWS
ncbi:MAG TPA: hypothetical protein VFF27_15625 [Bacteroidia bacterium]|nr:hypothetical protein [Bacteroidia bacterium]